MPKLWTDYPDVVAQFHPTKNGTKKLEDYKCMSHKRMWWLCPVSPDHEWECTIDNRVGNERDCPCCAGRKVVPSNAFSTTHPDVAKTWHPTKNGDLKPEHFTAGSRRKVWWICDKGHEWKTSITNKSHGNVCRRCSEPKGEKRTLEAIKALGIYHEPQFRFDNCRNKRSLPFDFLVIQNGSVGLIEYQGEQHYQASSWGGEKGLAKVKHHDQIKQSFCDNLSIPLLKIPYWDVDKIPQLVTEFVQSLPQQCA